MSEFSHLCGNERFEVYGDEAGYSPEKWRLYAVFFFRD